MLNFCRDFLKSPRVELDLFTPGRDGRSGVKGLMPADDCRRPPGGGCNDNIQGITGVKERHRG
jgi:hypothetical protein